MSQVLLHLPFRNSKYPSQLIGCEPSIGQEINDALTRGPFRRHHARMVRSESKKSQMIGAGLPQIIVSLVHVKVAQTPPFCQNPTPHRLSHHE